MEQANLKFNQISTIKPELLQDAEFAQFNNNLLIKLKNGQLLIIKDYFIKAEDPSAPLEIQTPSELGLEAPIVTTNSLGLPNDLTFQEENEENFANEESIGLLSKLLLPEALLAEQDVNSIFVMEADVFSNLSNELGFASFIPMPTSPISAQFESIENLQAEPVELPLITDELLAEILNIDGDIQLLENELFAPDIAVPSNDSESAIVVSSAPDLEQGAASESEGRGFSSDLPADLGAVTSTTIANDTGGVPINYTPEPADISRLSDSLGALGANQSSLSSVNGTAGTAYNTNDVNGINGNGNSDGVLGTLGSGLSSDGVSGALGAAAPTALAPPSDSFSGSIVSPGTISHDINFDGQLNLSFKDINWDALTHLNDDNLASGFGFVQGSFVFKSSNSDASSNTQDLLVFSDSGDFKHNYAVTGGLTTTGGSQVEFSYVKMTGFTNVSDATTLTLNYTLNGAQQFVIDVSAASDGQQVADIINSQLGVTTVANDSAGTIAFDSSASISGSDAFDFSDGSDALGGHIGFKAVWDGVSLGIANYNNVTINNATLAGAGGSSTVGSYTSNLSANLSFFSDSNYFLAGSDGFYYQPGHLHPLETYIVYNTNISRYEIQGENYIDEQFAISGANNPDFLYLDTGQYDIDTLSFYLPSNSSVLPGDPNAATVPTGFGDGDADYDLVTQTAYTKIDNIEILEARNYGTNNIVLNQAAVSSISEEMKWVDFNGDDIVDPGEDFFLTHSQHWTLSIAGDPADIVTLTDESSWSYQGIIDESFQNVDNWVFDSGSMTWKTYDQYNTDNGDTLSPLTKAIDSTRDAYGNILYQFKATNGGESYYLNVSADILNHPDWYYTGTAGDDALELPDTQFGSVDFGAGVDTLELHSGLATKTQDFTGEGGDLANVEIINTTNTYREVDGSNVHTGNTPVSIDTITVDKTFVTAATDANNTLSLIGDNADSVTVSDIQTLWNYMGQINSSTSGTNNLTDYTFQQYKAEDGTTLNVELEMADSIGTYYNGFSGDFAITPVSTTYDGIDGGTGTDSLGFSSATQNFTNASININTISNIEVIEGNTHSGATTITVNQTVVDTITDSDNVLSVLGEAGVDVVSLSDASQWSFAGLETGLGGQNLYQYKAIEQTDDSVLNIQANLATIPGIFFNGGLNSGVDNVSDKFTALDLNFISLNGGGGVNDWLLVSSDDYNFTTAGIAAKIDELEVIDARGDSNNNTVTLNQTAVAAMTNAQNTMTVMGDANDSVVLSDLSSNTSSSWSYIGHVDGLNDFVGLQFYQYLSTDGTDTTVNVWDAINNQPDVVVLGDITGTGITNNLFQLENTNYSYLDGLTGTDTLQMISAGSFDFSALGSQTVNIEVLSIEGIASGLTLSADFTDAASSNNNLVALGDSGDTLTLSDASNWTYAGYVGAANPWPDFHVYRGNDAGTEVLLYADIDFGAPVVDAMGTDNNDSFRFLDKNDANVDGGAGFDSLTLLSSVANQVDLTTGKTVSSIELLDVANSSTDNVTFNLSTVSSAASQTMYIQGDAGLDSVNTAPGESWVLNGRSSFSDAPDMYLYQNSSSGSTSSLYVQTDLVQNLFQAPTGTSGDDILTTLQSTFGSIDGGGGFDRLRFVQEGSIDISDAGNTLTSIEVLDLTNNQANTLILDSGSAEQMSEDTAVFVLGDTNDNLQLQGDWSQGQSFNVSADLTLNSYTSLSDNQPVTVYSDSQLNTSASVA